MNHLRDFKKQQKRRMEFLIGYIKDDDVRRAMEELWKLIEWKT